MFHSITLYQDSKRWLYYVACNGKFETRVTMASKENFRNKNTEKKYFKVDFGESGFNCVNWTEIKDNELWFLHYTHPCQCSTMFL